MAEGNAPGDHDKILKSAAPNIRKSNRLRNLSGINYNENLCVSTVAIDVAIEQDLINSAASLSAFSKIGSSKNVKKYAARHVRVNSEDSLNIKRNLDLDQTHEETATTMSQEGIERIVNKLDELKLELKKDIAASKTELEKKIQDATKNKVEQKVLDEVSKQVKDNVKKGNFQAAQIQDISNVIVRQNQELVECKQEIERLHKALYSKSLSIEGLIVEDDHTPAEQASIFFQTIMKIEIEIRIQSAYSTGKDKKPVVHLNLLNPGDKGEIFKKASNLAGVKNKFGRLYRLKDYRTAKVREEKKKLKDVLKQNAVLPVGNRTAMEMQKGKLMIGSGQNVVEYKCPIQPPSVTILTGRKLTL